MIKFKSHFWYNKSQRNGILFLAFIIIVLQLFYFFVDFSGRDTNDIHSKEILHFQQEIDSLKAAQIKNEKQKLFPFNPSFITDFKGYQLGMSPQEIDRLHKHREKGKYINSVLEFQKVTKVSDSLLTSIAPYFKFPDWITNKTSTSRIKTTNTFNTKKIDLNTITSEDLREISGIGDILAKRILSYKNKLGGYSFNEQLYEVYGLKKETADKLLERFIVVKQPFIKKINVNDATFKEVLSIVYLDYELTKKIFDYKDEVAEIQSLEELKKIDGFPLERFDRIALYLEAK